MTDGSNQDDPKFPAPSAELSSPETAQQDASDGSGGRTVLLVDLNPRTRSHRVKTLSARGLTVHSVGTTAAALSRFVSGSYNLVVIDPAVDANSANQLVAELRQRNPRQMVAFFVEGPPFMKVVPLLPGKPRSRVPVSAKKDEAPAPTSTPFDFGERIRDAEARISRDNTPQ